MHKIRLDFIPQAVRPVLSKAKLCLPKFTPGDWWECDALFLDDKRRWIEIETKVSKSDFRADAKKASAPFQLKKRLNLFRPASECLFDQPDLGNITKWQVLERHPEIGPHKFYFAAPHGVLLSEDIPAWAGLITFGVEDDIPRRAWIAKAAPKRNDNALSDAELHRALRNISLRYAYGKKPDDLDFGHARLNGGPSELPDDQELQAVEDFLRAPHPEKTEEMADKLHDFVTRIRKFRENAACNFT